VATTPQGESPWASTVVLGDGESAFIRPLVPSDQEALAGFHRRQSSESVYRRFFSPKPTLSERELERFTTVDMIDRAALAVELHDEFVGWASYERWPGRNEAEAAFMVDDEHHGRGIGTLLLEHLAAIARSNGIERFTAEVLGDNRAMLSVFAKAGWPLQRRFDSGVVDLDWELAATDDYIDSVERREHRADSRAVARILLPRAIAVIGASDRPGTIGNALWTNVRRGATVPVHPVNPRHDRLDGQTCFAAVADLPEDVSLAIIAVPVADLEATIDACIDKRMRGAVVITNIDDPGDTAFELQTIVSRARRNGLRIIGPSSMGVASLDPESRLQAALVDVTLPAGGVAISMQSGSLGGSVLRRASDLHLGLSWFISLGDKSDVSANDLLQFWEDDDNTRVIAIYTETLGNPSKFARIARRVSQSKPIVSVRTGAAASGALGGALDQQAGLIEVPTVHEMLDTSRVLASQPVLRGPRIAVITNSRSPGTLARAALERVGLEPVDHGTVLEWSANTEDFVQAVGTALARSDVDGLFVIHAPPVAEYGDDTAIAIDRAAAGATKPVVAVMIGSGDGPIHHESTVPGFSFPEQAAAALDRSYRYDEWLRTEGADPAAHHRPVDPERANDLIATALAATPDEMDSLDIERASELVSTYGIPVASARCATPATAASNADELGYPVAVKAIHRTPGRSARAGIALDLNTRDDVVEAVDTIVDALGDEAGELVVQRMTEPGVDARVRCERDDRTGAIVSVGYGGVNADVINDRTSRLAPVSPASAAAMLGETKVGAAIAEAGFDPSPLVDIIVQTAQLCDAHDDIDTIDLNPVIVAADDAAVTDVSIVLRERADRERPIRRLT
jgi:acyl-CoA synthetase (NDP forming)/GNAT superfamily N-acetyltransferase